MGACVAVSVLASSAQADTPGPSTQVTHSALSTGAIVQGIVGYTAWPSPRGKLLVCVTRNGADSGDVQYQFERPRDPQPWAVKLIDANQVPPQECDVIYFDGWSPEPQRAALRGLAQRPVLTVGRGPEFCSDGGLFCLESRADGMHFEVNLDAVARSGLRVHPQVLRLAHPQPGKPS